MKRFWMAAAFGLAMGAMAMPASWAQGGGGDRPGGGRPGGNRGGFGGLMGTVVSVSETELVITPMFGGRGGRPGGGRPQQGGGEPPQNVTVKLNAETGYSEMADGKEDDLVKGVFVSAAGEGEDTIDAKAIATCEAAPEDTEGAAAMRALFLASMPLRMIAMRGQQGGGDPQNRPRIGMAIGELINEIPYTVKARGRDGDREVTLTVADATTYFKLNSIKNGDLVVGRMVSIAPVRQQDGQGGPGGNRQAFEPLQGGDQQPPREIIASMVLMMPEMQRPGGGNGAPPQ